MFSLESPHRGDSNEYIQHTIINIKKKITRNYPKYNNVCSYGISFDRFEIAVVIETSVFEPLKFCCICLCIEKNTCLARLFNEGKQTVVHESCSPLYKWRDQEGTIHLKLCQNGGKYLQIKVVTSVYRTNSMYWDR